MPALTAVADEEESIQKLIDRFRKTIPKSKSLAEDAESFCEELEELLEDKDSNPSIEDFARFLRDRILDQEPDATLRKKIDKFTELIIVDKASIEDIKTRM